MRRSVVLLSTLMLFFSIALVTPLCAADSLSLVSIDHKRVQLTATMGVDQVRYFTLDSPKRLVVDLYGVLPGEHGNEFQLGNGFSLLRVGPLDNKTRFVFDVSGATFPVFNVSIRDDYVDITWESSQGNNAQILSEPSTFDSAQITAIDFASINHQSKLYINITGVSIVSTPVISGNKVQFLLSNTTLPSSLRRVFDTLAFPSAIYSVTPYLVNDAGQPAVKFIVTLKGEVAYSLQKTESGYVFTTDDEAYGVSTVATTGIMPVSAFGQTVNTRAAETTAGVNTLAVNPVVNMPVPVIKQDDTQSPEYSGEKTSLVFDNAEIRDVLRLIAEISDLNIIASDDVDGNVTLRLIDVPWDHALDLILDVTGLGMIQQGNVVRVLPIEKIRSMKEAELTAERSQEKLESLVTEVVTVSYADLDSVSAPVQNILSDRGAITADARNKLLIITDVPSRIEKAKGLIEILDTPERQVMIEARIVQVNSNYSRDLGVHWGMFGSDVGNGVLDARSINTLTSAGGDFLVSPVTAGTVGPINTGAGFASQIQIGRALIDDVVLDLQLQALQTDGKGKVISTPRVTTLNGETATISQGTTIPYQTSGADGPKTEFINAELKLEVTPVINPDGSIILEILATNDSPSLTAGASAPSIDTKKAETKVLIHDGETTVIGGIFVESTQESAEGIPGLMNVPVLGNLFKSQKKQTVKDELLIFITPRILHTN